MRLDGHYDREADIVWLCSEAYDGETVVGEETGHGLREVDPTTGAVVGLEIWEASARLPGELLELLPPPQATVPAGRA